MALFGSKKKTDDVAVKGTTVVSSGRGSSIILRPRVTEKSHAMAEDSNVLIFEVADGASKGAVAQAIKELYKVTPRKVSVVPIQGKRRISRGRIGFKKGGRKAYVYLNKGDKIETA